MRIAVPSKAPGGMEAELSAHFGHCDAFTVVDVDQQEVTQVEVIPNMGHSEGGCLAPVSMLKNAGVEALIAGGMGARPLAGFQQTGIKVFFNEGAPSVSAAVELVTSGQARLFGPAQVCGGGGNCGNH